MFLDIKITSIISLSHQFFVKPDSLKSSPILRALYLFKTNLGYLKIHFRFSRILKRSNKSVWCFLTWKSIHILKVYSIHYKLRQNTNVKKTSFGQNKHYKIMYSFFFCELTVLIRNSYTSWNSTFISLKGCVWFSIFNFVSFLLKFIFLFNKKHGVFDFKTL